MFLRSSSPTISIWCFLRLARLELKKVRPFLFSAIHLPAKVPSWMSERTARIRALVSSWGMTRGPETYSPYSAVSEME